MSRFAPPSIRSRNRRGAACRRRLFLEVLEDRRLLAALLPYQNSANPYDVNADGAADGVDLYVLDQELKANGERTLAAPNGPVQYYWDVDGNNQITYGDVDRALRFLTGTLDQLVTDGPSALAASDSFDSGGGASTMSCPTVTLYPAGNVNEGAAFSLTGTISPPGWYYFQAMMDWGQSPGNGGPATVASQGDGSFTIPHIYFDDGPSPGNGTPYDPESISLSGSIMGCPVSASTTATVNNVSPVPQLQLINSPLLGGPAYQVSGTVQDASLMDKHTVTVSWGDGSATVINNLGTNEYFITNPPHEYPPREHHEGPIPYIVTASIVDDDTGGATWGPVQAPMYVLDLDNDANNNGLIEPSDDPIEHVSLSRILFVNNDDDNQNGHSDLVQAPVPGENDLAEFQLDFTPAIRPDVDNYNGWHVTLDVLRPQTTAGGIVWQSPDKSGYSVPLSVADGVLGHWIVGQDQIPDSLYLEGTATGPAGQPSEIWLQLRLWNPSQGLVVDTDTIAFTVKPSISVDAYDAVYEDSFVSVVVSLSGPFNQSVSVDFAIEEGIATSDDYSVHGGTVMFAPFETSKTIQIPAVDDPDFEDDEWLRVVLSNPVNAILSVQSEGSAWILDNDPYVVISKVVEGLEPFTIADPSAVFFSIELLDPTGLNPEAFSEVSWTTSGGTATPGTDFVSSNGVVQVSVGSLAVVQVPLIYDGFSDSEGIETFYVDLTNATNDVTIVVDRGQGLIHNALELVADDPPPDCQCGAEVGRTVTGLSSDKGAEFWEGDTVTFTATLSSPTPAPNETFDWEYREVTVSEGHDPPIKHYGAWKPFGAPNSPSYTHTFASPFIGQVRVKLTSAETISTKTIDVRAKAAYPVNFTNTGFARVGGHLEVTYTWASSSGRLADLDGVRMGEYVWYSGWGFWLQDWFVHAFPNPPFDWVQADGHYVEVADATLGTFTDEHGPQLKIVATVKQHDIAKQYYWYQITDGASYLHYRPGLPGEWTGDPRDEIKFRWSSVTYSVFSDSGWKYKIDKGSDGSIVIDLSGLNLPWTAQ